jgi:hypothetical protein
MSEYVPKLLELKFLKKFSKVIILPMLIASYISQTGLNFSFYGFNLYVNPESSFMTQLLQFTQILCIKSAVIAMPLWLAHNFMPLIYGLTFMNWFQRSILPVVALLPITFGFLGIFSGRDLPFLSLFRPSWFYTAFILGFYLLSIEDEMDLSGGGIKDENDLTYPRRSFPLAFWREKF